jgi:hypothetical protein
MSERRPDEALEPALEALDRAYREAAAIVEAAPSSREGLKRAAALFRVIFRLRGEAARLRYQKGRRVWEEEELSLAQVAALMDVTKGRAGQMFPAGQREGGKA